MKNILRWTLLILGGAILVVLLVLVVMKGMAEYRMGKHYSVEPEIIVIPDDSASVAAGGHIVSYSCVTCHGDRLEGKIMFSDPALGHIDASNLTSGRGGIGGAYTDADWIRAIRHGVRPDGKPLVVMPSESYTHLSDADLGAVIAYLKQLPPEDHELGGTKLKLMGKVLLSAGAFGNILSAEVTDHSPWQRPGVKREEGVALGEYLVLTNECRTCHGADLGGGKDPNPDAPYAPNLTMGSISIWNDTDFIRAMRTGERPGGVPPLTDFMPWKAYGKMTDAELRSVWMYLGQLPDVQRTQ